MDGSPLDFWPSEQRDGYFFFSFINNIYCNICSKSLKGSDSSTEFTLFTFNMQMHVKIEHTHKKSERIKRKKTKQNKARQSKKTKYKKTHTATNRNDLMEK